MIDGVELAAHPRVLAAAGKIHDVPIIFGTNRDEGTLFVDAPCGFFFFFFFFFVLGVGLCCSFPPRSR